MKCNCLQSFLNVHSSLRLVCRIDGEVSGLEQSVDITMEVNEKTVDSGYFISGNTSIQGFSFVVMTKTFSNFNYSAWLCRILLFLVDETLSYLISSIRLQKSHISIQALALRLGEPWSPCQENI